MERQRAPSLESSVREQTPTFFSARADSPNVARRAKRDDWLHLGGLPEERDEPAFVGLGRDG